MAGKGETVKYIIDADTSGFTRGMLGAAATSEAVDRRINRALSKTSAKSENNFADIRKSAGTAASSIRNFAVAFSAFNVTSAIIGVTALSGALIELSGAIAAAGSTALILPSVFAQGAAASFALRSGVFGLGDAFDAVAKNDGKKFLESLSKLGPEATAVAYAVGGLNQAMNSIRLNTQQALLAGIGDTLLKLGANTLPVVNQGFQQIGQAMNRVFKIAGDLASSPAFGGLLSVIFSDTARTVDTLSGTLAPLLTMFTNLYMITAPYVELLARWLVNISQIGAAYLSSAEGQNSLNRTIMEGVIALQQIGSLVRSVFGFLIAIFRTSVTSGTSLITTIVGIVDAMTAWVNSAKGQAQLAALFQFTALTITTVANAIGTALGYFFNIIQAVNSLNPAVQQLIVNLLASALVVRPVISYFSQLYLAFRVLAVTIFNFVQQAIVVAGALGGIASIALLLGGGLIVLGSIIKGPLGGALIIIGGAIAAYIGLNYLLTMASNVAAQSILRQGQAAIMTAGSQNLMAFTTNMATVTMLGMATAAGAAGTGLSLAARGAMLLQVALVPLLVLASGVLIILSMLGVFSNKAKGATTASAGLGSSLGALQKSLKSVGASGSKGTTGIENFNSSLQDIGQSAEEAQGSLAGFDKMNVLTDNSAASAGLPAMPALPAADFGGLGGGGIAIPEIDTTAFDTSMADMTKQFEDLQSKMGEGVPNPFAAIGEFITSNPVPFFIAFAVILGVIIALFATGAVTIGLATLPLTLIVIAIIAIIAIIILLVQNWDAVWATIQQVVANVGSFIQTLFTNVGNFIGDVLTNIGNFFATIFAGIWIAIQWYINLYIEIFKFAFGVITTVWNAIVDFFTGLWNGIVAGANWLWNTVVDFFRLAWLGVTIIWDVVKSYFKGVWDGIVSVFSSVGKWFGDVFNGAWNAIKTAFSAVGGFFQGIWNNIVSIFGSVGTAIGNAIGGAFKSVVNTVLNAVSGIVNSVIDLINGAIGLINNIPGVSIGKIGRLTLPRLAKGGVVSGSTFAEIGEDGAEAVMPLENNTGWIDKLADRINSANGNSGGQPLELTIQIGEEKIVTKMIDLINDKTQMTGRNAIRI